MSAGRHDPARSIPAYAGETLCEVLGKLPDEVDPRVRGGDDTLGQALDSVNGRSPRTRGRPGRLYGINAAHRSIPAYAGETRCARLP